MQRNDINLYHLFIQMRIVRRDFARYNDLEMEDESNDAEYGWKIIHTDVFRIPKYPSLFSAILGNTYTQLGYLSII